MNQQAPEFKIGGFEQEPRCFYKFKGVECGYTGEVLYCGGTIAECQFLGNAQRFPASHLDKVRGEKPKIEKIQKVPKKDLSKLKKGRRALAEAKYFNRKLVLKILLIITTVLTILITGVLIQSYFDFKADIKALQQFKKQTEAQLRKTNDKANAAHVWILEHEHGFTK